MNFVRTAIARPVTVAMFVVAVMLFGLVSQDRMALNLLPDISYPSLTIQTDYEDAAPEEIEALITRPIEESVGVVPGLRRLSSISRSGQSEVVLEFRWDTNMDFAALDVREKLDVVTFPRDVENPVLLRFDPSNDPILRLQLYGEMSLSRLRYLAERELKRSLESTDGVAAVKIVGGLEEQVRIEIDEKRLAELEIPITEVTRVLEQENLNQASGSLYDLDANYLVRMLNQFRSVEEMRRIIIRERDGRKVVLGDVARVRRGTKDRELIVRLDGGESVEMGVYKEGDANTVKVAQAVKQRLESLKKDGLFPEGLEYRIVFNQAEFIEQAVENVFWAAILGGLLAILVLYVFLRDLRSTLTIGLSIPIAIFATLALMYQTDISLNIMSLGGIALGVGMLVDNSIVVLESVHRYKRTGVKLAEAVYQGTREVGKAVTASTLTTVAVFAPLVWVEGIAGQLFKDQALTITYALLASLLVALTFIPMMMALKMGPPAAGTEDSAAAAPEEPKENTGRFRSAAGWSARQARRFTRFVFSDMAVVILTDVRRFLRAGGRALLFLANPLLNRYEEAYEKLSRNYPRWLVWSLDHKGSVIGAAGLSVAVAVVLALRLGAELIPPLTQGEFAFEIELSEGAPLKDTDRLLQALEERVGAFPEVGTVFSTAGGSNKNQFARASNREHVGQLYIVMQDKRDQAAEERTIERIRNLLDGYPEVRHKFGRPMLFSFKAPIEVEIYGYDLAVLRDAADRVAARMENIRGLSDIQTSTQLGSPEIQIRFRRDRLARLNLEEGTVAGILRNKIRGEVASRYRVEDKQIDILVRAKESDRASIEDLKNLVVNRQVTNNANPRPNSRNRRERRGSGEEREDLRPASTTGANGPQAGPQETTRSAPPIRLGAVADIVVGRGPSEVRRIRSQRAAVVSANLTGRDLNSVANEIQEALGELRRELPPNTNLVLGGQNEELATSYRSLLLALSLAVFLVYLVMASQFESFIHPFIIIFTVPLSAVGVVLALFLTQTTLSVIAFLGVIILAGIVVNNAIVLIDYTNQLRRRGASKRAALLEAGQVRLRPILMTTLTTALGLAPMAVGWGEGSEVRAPMAVTVMGGLLFSTLLTLIFIPVIYELVDRKQYRAEDDEFNQAPGAA